VRLLNACLDRPTKTERSTKFLRLVLILTVVAFLTLLGVAVFVVLRMIIGLLN